MYIVGQFAAAPYIEYAREIPACVAATLHANEVPKGALYTTRVLIKV